MIQMHTLQKPRPPPDKTCANLTSPPATRVTRATAENAAWREAAGHRVARLFASGRNGSTPGMKTLLRLINLSLLFLFPIAWFAPLMRAGLLPIFGLSEISIVSGLQSLWASDVALALLVTFLAIFAPYLKVIGIALIQYGYLRRKILPVLEILGKLAMGDVFLIALYIVIAKGAGHVTVYTGWGLYLFTGCILASLAISHLTRRRS
jgi:uncharacterized paraquat-inducible protein A